jgi:hypothetical protein
MPKALGKIREKPKPVEEDRRYTRDITFVHKCNAMLASPP